MNNFYLVEYFNNIYNNIFNTISNNIIYILTEYRYFNYFYVVITNSIYINILFNYGYVNSAAVLFLLNFYFIIKF
jgi:hypothetical protein